jgi:hypothetical protein
MNGTKKAPQDLSSDRRIFEPSQLTEIGKLADETKATSGSGSMFDGSNYDS